MGIRSPEENGKGFVIAVRSSNALTVTFISSSHGEKKYAILLCAVLIKCVLSTNNNNTIVIIGVVFSESFAFQTSVFYHERYAFFEFVASIKKNIPPVRHGNHRIK